MPYAVGFVGVLFTLRSMIFSGFRLVPGDAGDTRFCGLLLEYSYRWLLGQEGGRPYWDFPIFYPVKNALAYSETLLGVGPFYWIWRVLGVPADSAYALWLIAMLAATFASGYVLFRRGLGLGELSSSAGAWLLAFGSPRIAQLNHPQLTPMFWGVLAIYALVRAWRDPGRRPWLWPWIFGGAMALQFYSGIYTAVFLVLAILLGASVALVFPWTRKAFLLPLRDPVAIGPWVVAGAVSLLTLYPMVAHYGEAARSVGVRKYWHVEAWLPRMASWLFHGELSWLFGWTSPLKAFKTLPMGHEQQLGIGLVTPVLVLIGLARAAKERASARIGLCVLVILWVTATYFPPGFSLWKIWYHSVPGVNALRSVSRIGIFLLLPAALGFALWAERYRARGPVLAAGLLLVFLEQGRAIPTFDIVKARETITDMSREVESRRCPSFFAWVTGATEAPWKYHIDAMWTAVETSVPTLNGYSGNFPAGWWDLYDITVRSKAQSDAFRGPLSRWALEHAMDRPICQVEVRVR